MNRKLKSISLVLTLVVVLVAVSGCVPKAKYNQLVRLNDIQRRRIEDLLNNKANQQLSAEQWKQKYQQLLAEQQLDQQKFDALQAALAAKRAEISQLTEQLGRPILPVALSSALSDWARQTGSDLVTYDPKNGLVRFKSDLLFDKGDATIKNSVKAQLQSLSSILNSAVAKGFDIIIVGHTDDIPILKPSTKAKFPNNWYLSAARAIAVESVLAQDGLTPTRMAIMGMGQYRPIAPNKPGHRGNPKNRRVEIYIVPAGQIGLSSR